MTAPYLVRPVAPDDFAQWSRLWDGYHEFYGRLGPTALPEMVTTTTWQRFLDPQEPVHSLVAEAGGTLVGMANYLFHRNPSMVAPTCYLQDIFTDPTGRGQGVGRALIEAVYARARLAGSTRVYWQTHETNRAAMQLYDKLAVRSGFVVYRKDL